MHHAAKEGHLACLKLVVDNGADVNTLNKEMKTALDVASSDDIKAYLTQHGAHDGVCMLLLHYTVRTTLHY